jgi:glutaredoxin 3
MKPVTLYTTDNCSKCVGAKLLLGKRGISYEEINLSRDPDGRARLAEQTGMVTFPQIVIGDQTIGGFDDLVAAARAGHLAELLAEATPAA